MNMLTVTRMSPRGCGRIFLRNSDVGNSVSLWVGEEQSLFIHDLPTEFKRNRSHNNRHDSLTKSFLLCK